jgi:CubicO group peptidase (beta-lactamase class C family)
MNCQRLRLACLLSSALLLASPASHAQAPQPPFALPAFTDTGRAARIEALLPEIEKLYQEQADKEHLPGLAYGILLDGQLIHAKGIGFANVEQKLAAAPDSRFRIASMSKSLVALAALKLRDEGKLRLDDPIAKYLPEAGKLRRPTVDSPAITVRQLMTMSTGLPEDNPWGDRQMELSNAALAKLVGGGLSFSTATGQGFEYSNLGFMLLGKVVAKAAGMRFQDYVAQRILKPLGMADTGWEYASMPKDKLALGYRWTGSAWELEPMLHDGDAAAMGGLITTIQDWSRYSAFLLSAWPPRDEADNGPVKRATLRELQAPQSFAGLQGKAKLADSTPNPTVGFYAHGLVWSRDGRGVTVVTHNGGLPGFGSHFRVLPDYGLAIMAFGNVRYAPLSGTSGKVMDLILDKGKLQARTITPSAILLKRQQQVAHMLQHWDAEADSITADNFFLDRSRADWVAHAAKQLATIGKVISVGELKAENQLRGSFPLVGEQGTLEVSFTLTPEREPKVQELKVKAAAAP